MIVNKLRQFRLREGLSQDRLAQDLNVCRETIQRVECGKNHASLELAFLIAEYFDVAIEDIFSYRPDNLLQ